MGSAAQKFRLPFKNSGASDMEIEFSFAKQSAVVCGPTPINKTKDSSSSSNSSLENGKPTHLTTSPIEFSVVPPMTMKVPTNGSVILNI